MNMISEYFKGGILLALAVGLIIALYLMGPVKQSSVSPSTCRTILADAISVIHTTRHNLEYGMTRGEAEALRWSLNENGCLAPECVDGDFLRMTDEGQCVGKSKGGG